MQSNGATLGVTDDDAKALALETEEVEETPQGVVEWTPDDVI